LRRDVARTTQEKIFAQLAARGCAKNAWRRNGICVAAAQPIQNEVACQALLAAQEFASIRHCPCVACADCAIDGLLKWICAASIKLVTQWILSDETFAAGYAPLRGSRNIGAIASPLRTPLSDRI